MPGLADSSIPLRVMTFNLCRAKPQHRVNAWDRRVPAVVDVLHRHAPDLVGTQEGLPSQLHDIQAHFPEYGTVGSCRFGAAEDEYNAILYRRDRLTLLESGNFWLSDTPEVPGSRSWGNRKPRMATWARFRDRDSGRVFHHTNTHFDHEIPWARRRAARLVSRRLPSEAMPCIVTGDLNTLSWSRTFKHLTSVAGANLRDAAAVATSALPKRFGGTFHKWTGHPLYRIDYVLCHDSFQVGGVQTVRDRVDGRWPSDHFPFLAEVALAAEADLVPFLPAGAMPAPTLVGGPATSAAGAIAS